MARKNRTKLLSLDETTWELALKKTNFSQWVRGQLRSERNKSEQHRHMPLPEISTERLQWELKKRIEEQNHDEAKNGSEEE
jgi:hypothetical protein